MTPFGPNHSFIYSIVTNAATVSDFLTNREIKAQFVSDGGSVGDGTYALHDTSGAKNQPVTLISTTTSPYFKSGWDYPNAIATTAEAYKIGNSASTSGTNQLVTKSVAQNIGLTVADGYSNTQCVKWKDMTKASVVYYTVSLSASPSGGGTQSGAGSYASGTIVTITASPNSGYSFSRWSDGNTSASRSITVTSNISLTAYYSAAHNVGDIMYWDGSSLQYTPYTQWTGEGTPIAVCVISSAHASAHNAGYAKFVSVTSVDGGTSEDTMLPWGEGGSETLGSSEQYQYVPTWDNYSTHSYGELGYISSDLYGQIGSNPVINVENLNEYYFDASLSPEFAISPYSSGNGFNQNYNRTLTDGNALRVLDGWNHTRSLVQNYDSAVPAAYACYNYSTYGTSSGSWYLPSEGELGYLIAKLGVINAAINTCEGLPISLDYPYWSSTEKTDDYAYTLLPNVGCLSGDFVKNDAYYVRPFIAP